MAQELYWFYDVLAAGIALICLYCGAKRGLARSVALIALMIAALILSWLLATVGAPIIYEKAVRPAILNGLNSASEKTDPLSVVSSALTNGNYGVEMTDPEIEGVISSSSGIEALTKIAGEIKNNGSGRELSEIENGVESSVTEGMLTALVGDHVSPGTLTEILGKVTNAEQSLKNAVGVFLDGDRAKTAETAEELLIAPVVKMLLRGAIWVVSMGVLTVIAKLIANAFESLNKVPIIGPVNVVAGAAFGLLEAAVIIFVCAQAVRLLSVLTDGSLMFINAPTVEKSYVFKYFYGFDISSLFALIK